MALEYDIVKRVELVGDTAIILYADGKRVIAYPDGRGNFIRSMASAGAPPAEYDPWTPPEEPPPGEPAPGDWVHPLAGSTLTSGYGYRWGGFHYGIDLSTTTAAVGGPVKAPTDFVVTRAFDAGGSGNQTAGTYVKGNNGQFTFTFAHGADNTLAVAQGQTITKGTTLFMEGGTGNVTGTHLHFEIIDGVHADPWAPPYNNGAQFMDPLPILRSYGVLI